MSIRIVIITLLSTLLFGCSSVKSYGGGQYYVDGVGGFTNPHSEALRFCRANGNKQMQVISSSFVTGFSGTTYPALTFKCI